MNVGALVEIDEVVGAQIERVAARVRFEHGIEPRFVGVDRNFVGLVPGVAERVDEAAVQRFRAAALARRHPRRHDGDPHRASPPRALRRGAAGIRVPRARARARRRSAWLRGDGSSSSSLGDHLHRAYDGRDANPSLSSDADRARRRRRPPASIDRLSGTSAARGGATFRPEPGHQRIDICVRLELGQVIGHDGVLPSATHAIPPASMM